MEEIEEYSASLRRSFDKLRIALNVRFGSGYQGPDDSRLPELLRKVAELSARNAALEKELLVVRAACDDWKFTCRELVAKLDASIEVMRPILEQEKS